ncbi:MAG: MotA/TolQ/ExbB proton channel family protein [Deltaproteobacteria bacterium]|nr:MotA/TolQ/ExbB proton channel family protein [Deltaproteobacteria bacterium]
MFEFLSKGGFFMVPILLCSVAALGIFVERLWSLRRGRVVPADLVRRAEALVADRDLARATELLGRSPAAVARVLAVGVRVAGQRRDVMKEHLEEAGRQEAAGLERFVDTLGTIAGVSTLLGLLGTISGMIEIFSVISTQSVVDPATLAGGISEALVTTLAGLSVAIPTVVMHRYLLNKANALTLEMERLCTRFMDLLSEGAGDRGDGGGGPA